MCPSFPRPSGITPDDLEEEARPRRPPVVAARDERARAGHLDALAVRELLQADGRRELDRDLARAARVVGRDGREIRQRLAGALLDQLARLLRGLHPRAEAAEALLHLDGREAVTQQLLPLLADRAVAGHEENGHAPVAAE